jgi:hypothetical protein
MSMRINKATSQQANNRKLIPNIPKSTKFNKLKFLTLPVCLFPCFLAQTMARIHDEDEDLQRSRVLQT